MDFTNRQSQLTSRRRQLKDALEARDALEDILRSMDESPGELGAIFDVILEKALQLCHAQLGIVFLYDAGLYEAIGMRGLPTEPPRVAPARGPPHADDNRDQRPLFDTTAPEPDPGFEFDQRVSG